jgi:hypothetical protein
MVSGEAMIGAKTARTRAEHIQWQYALIWLTLAASCIVFIEPAPYDVLVMLLVVVLYPLKLRIPAEIAVAIFLLALFAAGNLIGALASGEPETTIRPLATRIYMLVSWVFFTSIIAANTEFVMKIIWHGYVFAALLAAVWGCLEYYDFLPEALVGDTFGRAKGPFKDANVFGPFLIPVALHLVSRMLHTRGPALVLEITKFLIIAFGLLLAFSRGAWINFFFAFGLYIVFSITTAPTMKEKIQLVVLVVFLSFAAGLSLSWAVNNTAAGQQFFDRATMFMEYDLESGGRFDTQAQVLREIGSTPLGLGPGMSTPEFGIEPHNLYLHTAIEGGWLAAVSFYLFLLLSVYRGMARTGVRWKLQSDLHVVLAVVLGTLLQSLFIDSTHWRHLWLLLAILWALTIAVDRSRASNRTGVMTNGLRGMPAVHTKEERR